MMILSENEAKARMYDIARAAMRPLQFPPDARSLRQQETERDPRPTPQAAILAELDALIAGATALRDKVAASPAAATPSATAAPIYTNAAQAFRDRGFPFNDQKVRRLCRANAPEEPSGAKFAVILAGTWYVIEPAFSNWAERIERGDERI